MSGNAFTATASPVPTPSNVSPAYLQLTCSKTVFLSPSGLNYNIIANASGVVTSIIGNAFNNINQSHIVTSAASQASWIGGNNVGNVIDISFNYLGNTKSIKYNLDLAASILPGTNDLARHLMLIISHAIRIRAPLTETDVITSTSLSTVIASLKANLATAIASALSTQPCQNAILQAIIQSNGPIVENTAGTHTLLYNQSTYSSIMLAMTITQLPVTVSFYDTQRTITLYNIPLYINLV